MDDPAPPHLIPPPVERGVLFGRDDERAAVAALLGRADVGLLTVTGPGGAGKTRLALAVAADVGPRFPDGVAFAGLAAAGEAAHVPQAIGRALGVSEAASAAPLAEVVGGRTLLLIVDNFEHVIDAAPIVADLLAVCPRLKVLATSRTALGIYGERTFNLTPMDVPDLGRLPPGRSIADALPALVSSPALALLTERARAVRPDFQITADNAAAVVAICRRLDGLPLAIELAAVRLRLLSPEVLAARLAESLDAVGTGPRDRPARHQTLRGAIAWSYDLLDPAEQALFRRLSVFVGGLTLDAATAVGGDEDGVVDRLESLVAKSLLRPRPGGDGEPRFALLEMLRAFALEQLQAGGEVAAARRAHLAWCLALVRTAEEAWDTPQQRDWIERIDAEHDNLRAALAWSLDGLRAADGGPRPESAASDGAHAVAGDGATLDDALTGARLALALEQFWIVRSQFAEGQRWSTRAAAVFDGTAGADPRERMVALRAIGRFANRRHDFAAAEAALMAAIDIARAIGEPDEAIRTLNSLGTLARGVGRMDDALAYYDEALALARQTGEEQRLGVCHYNLGALAMLRGDLAEARAHLEESRAITARIANVRGEIFAVAALGTLAAWEDDPAAAIALLRDGLALAEGNGIRDQAVFHARNVLASVLQGAGQVGEAACILAAALTARTANRTADAYVLWLVAWLLGWPVTIPIDDAHGPVHARRRRPDARRPMAPDRLRAAARLCGAARALADIHDAFAQNDATVAAANIAALQTALGASAFAADAAAGAALGRDAARADAVAWCRRLVAEAEAGGDDRAAGAGPLPLASVPPVGLSEREWAVARLIAEGRTYREVAEELSVVVKTVEKHVGGALAKLGLGNRTQLAMWVRDQQQPSSS